MKGQREKFSHWWYYHKWKVGISAVLLFCAADIGKDVLHIGEIQPDYQIAYVGENPLPDDTARQIENLFSTNGEDCNRDGKITAVLHQYPIYSENNSSDAIYYKTTADVALQSDLANCDSFFFLLEDPVAFQKGYDALSYTDGSLPAITARDYENMYISWKDSNLLSQADLGTYTIVSLGTELEGDSNQLTDNLYLARRGFWNSSSCKNPEGCQRLWEKLLERS
ncbi:MAG: hypothetical protein Q4B85_02185 [Lachnospiraceae bacterium]|nr:hypothetical protein [Lachnospiraceae bacterium]